MADYEGRRFAVSDPPHTTHTEFVVDIPPPAGGEFGPRRHQQAPIQTAASPRGPGHRQSGPPLHTRSGGRFGRHRPWLSHSRLLMQRPDGTPWRGPPHQRDPRGIKTGLDGLTNGFELQDLIVAAARPSIGKTTFALNIRCPRRFGRTSSRRDIQSGDVNRSALGAHALCSGGHRFPKPSEG